MVIREDALEEEKLISPELERQLWSYKGKWVVVSHSELVGVGQTAKEALEDAKQKGSIEGLLLHRVPEDEGRLNFF